MENEPSVRVFPRGLEDEWTLEGPSGEARPSAVVAHRGFELVFRFAPGDLGGRGELQELWVRPGDESLEPRTLRRFAPQAELYLAHARAAMRFMSDPLEPGDEQADLERRWERFHD